MRSVTIRERGLDDLGVDLLAVPFRPGQRADSPLARAVDGWLSGGLSRLVGRDAFRGKEGETVLFPGGGPGSGEGAPADAPAGRPDVLLVGLGDDASPREAARRAGGLAIRAGREARARSVGLVVPVPAETPGDAGPWQAAAEGLVLGDWEFDALRSPEERGKRPRPPGEAFLVPAAAVGAGEAGEPGAEGATLREAVDRGRLLAEAQNAARALVAQPGNIVTPRHLAAHAEGLAEETGLRVEAWGPERLRQEGFGALLAVSRGSVEEPRFVILEHAGEGGDPWVVVGKGVTFDAGGISLKPASGMESMKYDMAGAAAVLGIMQAAARLGVARRVIGLVPTTENLPSGSAVKPADVIRGVAGKSIEVVNTDAEGRLILSDALAYAGRLGPRAVVDLATLTGGCVVALGRHAIGMMSPDDGLAAELEAAGTRTGERVWRLPLWKEYRKQLDSDIADIKNTGGREASPITAGCFLEEFVGDVRWAHLDIAGTAWADDERPYQPKGATGIGVRLLMDWLTEAA